MFGEPSLHPYIEFSFAVKKSDLCEEPHPSDGKCPVKPAQDQKGGGGKDTSGHAERSRANDDREGNGHQGHRHNQQRPIEEQ